MMSLLFEDPASVRYSFFRSKMLFGHFLVIFLGNSLCQKSRVSLFLLLADKGWELQPYDHID